MLSMVKIAILIANFTNIALNQFTANSIGIQYKTNGSYMLNIKFVSCIDSQKTSGQTLQTI